jgi:hypothetical protein
VLSVKGGSGKEWTPILLHPSAQQLTPLCTLTSSPTSCHFYSVLRSTYRFSLFAIGLQCRRRSLNTPNPCSFFPWPDFNFIDSYQHYMDSKANIIYKIAKDAFGRYGYYSLVHIFVESRSMRVYYYQNNLAVSAESAILYVPRIHHMIGHYVVPRVETRMLIDWLCVLYQATGSFPFPWKSVRCHLARMSMSYRSKSFILPTQLKR